MTETRVWIWDLWLLAESAGTKQQISGARNQGEEKAGTENEEVMSVVQLKQ